jgi:hypothetical protein
MKFSLDYCEHRVSHAGLGASDSLIIPNGRIMNKKCLRPVIRTQSQPLESEAVWIGFAETGLLTPYCESRLN